MPPPSLSAIRASKAAFFRSSSSSSSSSLSSLDPPIIPTAVFVGGTSGIGEGMAHRRPQPHRRRADPRVPALASSKIDPNPAREFIQCDATLMKNVHRASSEILARYPKITFLVRTPGFSTLSGRDETTEGLDKKLAYYARWKFLYDLLPGLERAKEAGHGEQAAAISVMAAGRGGEVDLEDLGLKRGFEVRVPSFLSRIKRRVTLTAPPPFFPLAVLLLSRPLTNTHPRLPKHRAHLPRVVLALSNAPTPLPARPAPLPPLLGLAPRVRGVEYMWHGLTGTAEGRAGAWRTRKRGEDLGKEGYFGSEEARRRLWEHTVEVMRGALGEEGGTGKLGGA
ncbi:hypothetical protein CVT26_011883 [Gymnopilus dilepis]|uniref:NAD(P)-binding domain-containing protein n=1 Tax=Gymnopilus dilepis TaxID=231916 RepID=A0A409W5L2_9AGAR|nr:hypothetical protein CVT26_011883 [Gymnopilus dilepis]